MWYRYTGTRGGAFGAPRETSRGVRCCESRGQAACASEKEHLEKDRLQIPRAARAAAQSRSVGPRVAGEDTAAAAASTTR